ncbi:DUF2000 family protein [Aliikangiella coralliicola]|uniref:DUF2000 family protein n=1 Tax=Aliikangiella coralliicola TaxID=2592383 RepID=A0A545UCH7_9GAMM|nr:DUF2000 family protein [Aliikangiella coralliicola]TQV87169.1 DUF2000 family protein [Aliikangiella coralliicola]
MEFSTKFAIAVADDLASWQKLNVVAFLTSGVIGDTNDIIGGEYKDASDRQYSSLCIQPIVVLKSTRARLSTFLQRANSRDVSSAIYIEDMFKTGHDAANRETVLQYETDALPLVGMAVRAEKKLVDKIFKGAKLHD